MVSVISWDSFLGVFTYIHTCIHSHMWVLVHGLKCISIVSCGQKRFQNAILHPALKMARAKTATENSLENSSQAEKCWIWGSVVGPQEQHVHPDTNYITGQIKWYFGRIWTSHSKIFDDSVLFASYPCYHPCWRASVLGGSLLLFNWHIYNKKF